MDEGTFLKSFKDSDFKDMLFNVQKEKFNYDFLKSYPSLNKYAEFTSPLELGGVINPADGTAMRAITKSDVFRYIVYVYDKNSPFKKEEDMDLKKYYAAKYCGMVTSSGTGSNYTESMQKMFSCRNDGVNKMIIRYLYLQGYDKFSLLITTRESQYQQMFEVLSGQKDPDELLKMAKIDVFMDSLKMQVAQGDQRMSDVIFKYYREMEDLPTPEFVARARVKDKEFAPGSENDF